MKGLSLLCLTMLLGIAAFAQLPNYNVNFPSPNAASLGLYGEVPVSLHNGIPQISIPLYEINDGPIKVPVSLNYHASGVRPDVHPGWVGNGWSLSAGGMITRVVKGAPDETLWQQNLLFFDDPKTRASYGYAVGSFYNNLLQDGSWNSFARVDYLARKGSDYNQKTEYYQETEPDEFSFNVAGFSGKFVMDEYHRIKVISHPEIRVELDTLMLVQYPYGQVNGLNFVFTFAKNNLIGNIGGAIFEQEIKIKGFRITMPDGLQYEFGLWRRPQTADDIPIEASINFFQQVYLNESWDSWYLKAIKSPDGHVVNFEYNVPASLTYPIASFGFTAAMEKASGSSNPGGLLGIFGPVSASSSSITQYFEGRIIYPTYLTKITSGKEEISFNLGTSNELTYNYSAILSSLQVQANNSFDMNMTSYPSARNILLASRPNLFSEVIDFTRLKWLQLNSFTVKDVISKDEVKSCTFNFSNDATKRLTLLSLDVKGRPGSRAQTYSFQYNAQALPGYNSLQTDHWGFYNGKTPTVGSWDDASLYNYYNYKETDTTYLKAGILEKITYPTGGTVSFNYEANQYTSKVVRNSSSGAFSLQTVSPTYAGGLRIKEVRSNAGGGTAEVVRKYEYTGGILNGESQYFWKNYTGKLLNGNTYTADRFVTQTILPVSTNAIGSHIGYSKVKEFISGNGYTEYYFSNYDILDDNFLATIDVQKSRYSPFSSREAERGLLLKKLTYTESGKLLQQDLTSYPVPDYSNAYIRSTATKQFPILGGYAVEGAAYKLYNYTYDMAKTQSISYDTLNAAIGDTVTKDYTYDMTYNQVRTINTTNSKGEVVSVNFYHPYEMMTVNDPYNTYRGMWLKNILSPIVEENHTIDGRFVRMMRTNYYKPMDSAYKPQTVETRQGLGSTETRIRYYAYDSIGNVLTAGAENNVKTAYLWGYNKQYPVAACKNAENTLTTVVSPSTGYGVISLKPYTTYGSVTFTSTRPGPMVLYINSNPGKTYSMNYTLSGAGSASGTLCASRYTTPCYGVPETITLNNMPAGTYTLSATANASASDLWAGMSASYGNYYTSVTGLNEIFYTGFEDDANAATAAPFAGKKYLTGDFTVPFVVPNSRTYRVDYHYLQGGVWYAASKTYTGQGMVLTEGDAIDEVRVYPEDARMTTYTYAPLVGMTSQGGPDNHFIFYEYDNQNRLKVIRDDQGKVLKVFCYNYAGQPEECQ